jgi:hypothetical protein
MPEPLASQTYWPDAIAEPCQDKSKLKSWSWAEERLTKSHNYWIATSGRDGQPHLMIVWGVWLEGEFWFSTGARTRKARNLGANANCVVGTEESSEAVILEGCAGVTKEAGNIDKFCQHYDRKYGGSVRGVLKDGGSLVFRVRPLKAFGQDEHAENFLESATRWIFPAH